MLEWLTLTPLPPHSRGSSTGRWGRNTPRVVTARVFYVLGGFLTSHFIFKNSVETAAPFNVVSHHDVVSQENYFWKSFDLLLGSNLWPLALSAWYLTARPMELTSCLYVFVVRGGPQAVAYSAQPLCWSGWEPPPPPLTGEQYGKMEPKYPEGGLCQSALRPQGVFNVPVYFK